MSRKIDFYFDIMSPYSYFAFVKLPDLARKHGYDLRYHPMDIPSAKLAAGNYAPRTVEVPAKFNALKQDFRRWSDHYGVPFTLPRKFDTRRWTIAALYAIGEGRAEQYVRGAYDKVWAEGIDPTDDAEFTDALAGAGLNAEAAMTYAQSTQGEAEFKKSCIDAQGNGVFGAPTMIVDDQIFWGNDRLQFLEEYLKEASGEG